MLCVVCRKLSPDKFIALDNGSRVEFHSACAICNMCGMPDAQNVGFPEGQPMVFVHTECVFTPEQVEKYLELKRSYRPE